VLLEEYIMTSDQDFIAKAIEVGNQKSEPYNFGAVVVKDDEVLSAEHGHVQETNNPSLHAEVSAIIEACKKIGSNHLDGATLYASHEPCVMCLACAAWAHISRVVYVTPASEQLPEMYELKQPNAEALAKQFIQPIRIERIVMEEL